MDLFQSSAASTTTAAASLQSLPLLLMYFLPCSPPREVPTPQTSASGQDSATWLMASSMSSRPPRHHGFGFDPSSECVCSLGHMRPLPRLT